MNIIIYARNIWQAMDWLAKSTGRQDCQLFTTQKRIKLVNLDIYVITPEEDARRLVGIEADLIHFLCYCPYETREFLLTRWR